MLSQLSHLPLAAVEYHDSVGSTNDIAAGQLAAGAPDLTLIVAGEQTAGRGRSGRTWHTPAGTALAFSLVLRPRPEEPAWAFAPLAALAVHDALEALGLSPAIKWPNDVLLSGKKVCGVLVEAHWQGNERQGIVLGTGVNVHPGSYPPGELNFPAVSVEEALGRTPERWELLAAILKRLLARRAEIGSPAFVRAWESRLAYLGRRVVVGAQSGTLAGLNAEGSLLLETNTGRVAIPAGEISLRLER